MSQSEFNPAPVTAMVGQVWRTKAGGLFVIPEGINPLNFDLVEMVRDEHGFTIWRGGEQPVAADALVLVRLRSGTLAARPSLVSDLRWDHRESPGDIVAYKVVEEASAEPAGQVVDAEIKEPSISAEEVAAVDKAFAEFAGDQQPTDVGIDPGAAGGDRAFMTVYIPPGYDLLFDVLMRAFSQAAVGKGSERHGGGGLRFEEQPMTTINRTLGSVDGFLYQAAKKAAESRRLPDGRAQAELYGAINYLAGAVIAYDTWAKESLPEG